MANTAERLTGLDFNAVELKALTFWNDAVVEDYLNFQRNLLTLSEAVDIVESQIIDPQTVISNTPILSQKYQRDTAIISGDYETAGDQRIICINTDPVTITLSNTPDDLEELTITRTRDRVTLDGNGININGQPTIVLSEQYVSLELLYVAEINARVIT